MKRFVADTAVELGSQLALLEMISLLLDRTAACSWRLRGKCVARRLPPWLALTTAFFCRSGDIIRATTWIDVCRRRWSNSGITNPSFAYSIGVSFDRRGGTT